jgi:hypothetical protein
MLGIILFPFIQKYLRKKTDYAAYNKIRKRTYSFLGSLSCIPETTKETLNNYKNNPLIEELTLRFSGRGENIVAFCQDAERTKKLRQSPGFYAALALARYGKKVFYLDLRKNKETPPEFIEPAGAHSFDYYLSGNTLPHSLCLASKIPNLYISKRSETCPPLLELGAALKLTELLDFCLRHYDLTFIDIDMEPHSQAQSVIQYGRTLPVPCLAEGFENEGLLLLDSWKKELKIRCTEVLILKEENNV